MDINAVAGALEKREEMRSQAKISPKQEIKAYTAQLAYERKRWAWSHAVPAPGYGIDGYPLQRPRKK